MAINKESPENKDSRIYWTGPRESDIVDCEKNLFRGSITLYGSDVLRTDAESGDTTYSNVSFCNSIFNLKKKDDDAETDGKYVKGIRINHNKSTFKEDLFIIVEQLKILDDDFPEDGTYEQHTYFSRTIPILSHVIPKMSMWR